jgi:hypothetical protein
MAAITVHGKIVGPRDRASVVVVLPHEYMDRREEAEAFVEALTGHKPSTWIDGTGTTTVTASRVKAD